VRVELDEAGVRELLTRRQTGDAVNAAAKAVAAKITPPPGHRVVTDAYTTDRAAAGVALVGPQADGQEAKNGYITRAAAAVGLEVRRR